jgi:glutamate transport system substrate-binding protein
MLLAACGGADEQSSVTTPPATSQTVTSAASGAVRGSPTFDRIQQRGKITIGLRNELPGLSHFDSAQGAYSGFEVDIARLVAAKLGLTDQQILFKQLPQATGISAVGSGDVDVFVGGATADQAKSAQLLTAGPYLNAPLGLLYRQSGPAVNSAATAAGRKICSVADSTSQAKARTAKLTDADKLVSASSLPDCVDQLGSGTMDAVVNDLPAVGGYAAADPVNLAAASIPGSQPTDYAILLPGNDKALRDRLNQIVRTAVQDGTWQHYYDDTLGKSGAKISPPSVPS